LISTFSVLGQCPVADFELPSVACLNESLKLEHQATNSSGYEWFLCNTDYSASPSAGKIVSNYGSVYNSKFVVDGANTYLFFVSQTQNKLVGLRLTDLATFAYEIHCELDLSAYITNPAGIDIVNDDGTWTGLITSIVTPFKLVKLTLSSTFQTITDSQDLTSYVSLSTPFDVKILRDANGYFGFVTNSTGPVDQQLIRLSFGSALTNTPAVTYIALPSGSQAASLEFSYSCDNWTAFLSSRNGKLFRVDFGTGLETATPTVTDLTLSSALNDPGGLSLVVDHDKWVFIIQSRNGYVYSGKISSLLDNSVDITSFGNIKSSTRDWGVESFRFGDRYKIVSANFTNGGLGGFYTLEFTRNCPVNKEYSAFPAEEISFQQASEVKITLTAKNAEGDSHSVTKSVTVSNSLAPQISLTHAAVFCVNSPLQFNMSSDMPVISQTWDFGDGGGSSDSSPEYSYANSGTYTVIASATADNGCKNFGQSTVVIYEQPQADFSLVSGLMCTNNEFVFVNLTPDVYNGSLSYQWFVDDNYVSNDRDLLHTFTSTGTKDIKLITSIPGCASEIVKTTSQVEAGPVVDFSFSGTCEKETYSFQNQISESVETYLWDFGNGNTSSEPNPKQVFTVFGDYSVSLTATNSTGCENVKTKNVAVHSNPVVDFSAKGPPNACSGSLTELHNHTTNPDTREIASWLWHFNDSTTQTEKDGRHIFPVAGVYMVSLSATTADGCQAKGEKEVTIHASPSTDFTHTPACDDVPVYFTGPSGNDIASWYWEIGSSYYTTSSPTHTFKMAGDYPLYLQVTGANGCIAITNRSVHVPVPLAPDFSLIKNCPDHEAVFTDVTTGIDPVISQEWYFDSGETFTGSSLTYAFQQTGTQTVMFKVAGESGCVYQVSKAIEVFPAPVAEFTADPAIGAYPHEVTFTNTSLNATSYFWSFSDGAVSEEASPVYTFEQAGSYNVKLTASNEQQCEDIFEVAISTVAPLPDADIEMISLATNPDGTSKLIITIHNKGNTILKNIFLDIDFSGTLTLRQQVPDRIAPGSKFNVVLNTGIVDVETLRYLCAFIDLTNDIAPSGNSACKQFEHVLHVFPAYPNPATAVLNLEWISETDKPVRASLVDPLGRKILVADFSAAEGLNRQMLEVGELEGGLYTLLLEDGAVRKTQRILITR
jgi:PKD repeat protein